MTSKRLVKNFKVHTERNLMPHPHVNLLVNHTRIMAITYPDRKLLTDIGTAFTEQRWEDFNHWLNALQLIQGIDNLKIYKFRHTYLPLQHL